MASFAVVSLYLDVLRTRGARPAFVSATVARLPISMATLGAVILVQDVRDSYAMAGALTACFALGTAVGTPFWGRQLDRYGQAVVIGPIALVSAVLLVVFALGAVHGMGNAVLAVVAALAGLSFPPLSPAMRGAWQALLPAEEDRQAAYALEAVAIELVFILGPLFLSLLLATTPTEVPLIVTAGLLAGGSVAYVFSSASRAASALVRSRPVPSASAARAESLLRSRPLLVVLGTGLLLSAAFGQLDVSVAATAREIFGHQGLLGVLYLGIAGGSTIGGLWYGSRAWRGSDWRRLPVPMALCGVGMLLTAGYVAWLEHSDARTGLGFVLVAVFVLLLAGLFIAPSTIIQQNLVDAHAELGRRGEAQSWLNAGLTAGAAGGTALAGVLVDAGGAALGFLGAATALGLAALAGVTGRPRTLDHPRDQGSLPVSSGPS